MEKHQIRRVPVVDGRESCVGIISQADLSWAWSAKEVGELVREVSRDTGWESR
jgi:CBS-domain-containing membrane protein